LAVDGAKEQRVMYEYRKLTPEQRRQLVEERRRRGHPLHQPLIPCAEKRSVCCLQLATSIAII